MLTWQDFIFDANPASALAKLKILLTQSYTPVEIQAAYEATVQRLFALPVEPILDLLLSHQPKINLFQQQGSFLVLVGNLQNDKIRYLLHKADVSQQRCPQILLDLAFNYLASDEPYRHEHSERTDAQFNRHQTKMMKVAETLLEYGASTDNPEIIKIL